jgi:hypothetical protein
MVKYKESKKWTNSYLRIGAASSSSDREDSISDDPALVSSSNMFSHLLDLDNS